MNSGGSSSGFTSSGLSPDTGISTDIHQTGEFKANKTNEMSNVTNTNPKFDQLKQERKPFKNEFDPEKNKDDNMMGENFPIPREPQNWQKETK